MSFQKYAKLGASCQTNGNELISNTKFLPLDAPEYNYLYTRAFQYPGQYYDLSVTVGDVELPEDIKTGKNKGVIVDKEPYRENYPTFKKCCGK